MWQPQSKHGPWEFSGRISPARPPSEGSKLSSITLYQQSSNSALPANKCSCLLQRLTGWEEVDTVQTPSLLLENPPSPHADSHNPAKEVPFKHKGHLPAAWQSSAHYQQPVLSPCPKWPVQTQGSSPATVCLCFPWQRITNPATILHLKVCPLPCHQLTPGRSLGTSKERSINIQCSLGET